MRLSSFCLVLMIVGCGAPATDTWLLQLKDGDVVMRRQAIRELAARPADAEQVIPALIEALGDNNGYVRHDAALALGKFGGQASEAVPTLLAALQDKTTNVRAAAERSLKKIDTSAAVKAGMR
jgi:HEAT repeat protein